MTLLHGIIFIIDTFVYNYLTIIAIQETIDIEELVDDFATYYIAGRYRLITYCKNTEHTYL